MINGIKWHGLGRKATKCGKCNSLSHKKEININNLLQIFKHSSSISVSNSYVTLTNQVQRPCFNLRTEFFPYQFTAQAQSKWAINRWGRNLVHNLQDGPRTEDKFSRFFSIIIYTVFLMGSGMIPIHWAGMTSNFWSTLEAKQANLIHF